MKHTKSVPVMNKVDDDGDDETELNIPTSLNPARVATQQTFVSSVTIELQHDLSNSIEPSWLPRGEATVEFGTTKSRGNIQFSGYEMTTEEWEAFRVSFIYNQMITWVVCFCLLLFVSIN
jgi:hypothetical protein